jgi:glycosyltransferase involved in cell wall biosynthesis
MVFKRVSRLIVHSDNQARLARQLTTSQVEQVELPLIIQTGQKLVKAVGQNHQLLFFGIIRPYKGVDVLLRAIAKVPGVRLTIAGEIWGSQQLYLDLIKQLGLEDRVTLKSGYVPADELGELISQSDAVVLPYREGTGSWNVALAHAYDTPVIATTAGSLGTQVKDGVDGLLCKPDDAASLAAAIKHFYQPGMADKLRGGIVKPPTAENWRIYVEAATKYNHKQDV